MSELPEVEIIKLGLPSFQGDPKLASSKIVLNVWRKAKILGVG